MFIRSNLPAVKHSTTSFRPDFIAASVDEIDFKLLRAKGIQACFIDLDGTTVSRGTFDVDKKVIERLKGSRLPIFIATNRPKSRELKNLIVDLSAQGVVHPVGVYAKPTKRYYKRALAAQNLKPHQVVMIGDRYFQDIFGANRAGLYSLVVYKVGKIGTRSDYVVSKIEAWLTRFFTGKYIEL